MGYYLEVPDHFDKDRQLIELHGAWDAFIPERNRYVSFDEIDDDSVLICVVANPLFEAAGICYDRQEYDEFSDPTDPRPKKWVVMKKSKVKELNPRAPV